MNKNHIKYAIDIGMLISFILVFVTGILKFPALTRYFISVYRIIPAHTIRIIHDWSGLAMGILVLAHLIFNWNWIVAITKKMFKGEKI